MLGLVTGSTGTRVLHNNFHCCLLHVGQALSLESSDQYRTGTSSRAYVRQLVSRRSYVHNWVWVCGYASYSLLEETGWSILNTSFFSLRLLHYIAYYYLFFITLPSWWINKQCSCQAKIIGERYKAITHEERTIWENEALKDKERYNEEMQHYVSVDDDTGRKRAKKDPNAPKRNMSAYFLFSIAARPAYKKAYPDASFGDLAKIIGQAYKSLPDHEKQQWVKKAEHDKIRYQNELASYG